MVETETIVQALTEHPFLKGLNDRYLQLIAKCASSVRFEPKQYILREGQNADTFFLIRYGKVSIEVFAAGRGAITIQTVGEGEVLGWSWLIPPHQWRFDARATELTRGIALDGKYLRQQCDEEQAFGYELLKRLANVMSQRLHATRLQLLDMYGTHGEK